MSVRIVFANGSKQMSHNTDDLRERWELRQQITQEEIYAESKRGYVIPLPSNDCTLDQLLSLRDVYPIMQYAIAARRKQLYPTKLFRNEIAHLGFCLTEVAAAQVKVKERIKEVGQINHMNHVEEERAKLWHYAQQLERIVVQLGGELPPEPYEDYGVGKEKVS